MLQDDSPAERYEPTYTQGEWTDDRKHASQQWPAPQGSQPLISQVEQVAAPWIEGVQAVGQDYIIKTQTPPQQPKVGTSTTSCKGKAAIAAFPLPGPTG